MSSQNTPKGWQIVELNNSILEIQEQTSNQDLPILTSSRNGLVRQESYFNRIVASKNREKYKVIHRGQFTYRSMSDDGVFKINQLNICDSGVVSPAYAVFSVKNQDADFCMQLFDSVLFQNLLRPFAKGTTRLALKLESIKKVRIPLPPIAEQEKIAEILSTVDEVIQKTDEVISIAEKLKVGLMQDFFKRGVGHTKLKETDIGRIPEKWGVVPLDLVTHRGSGHTPNKQHPEYWNGGIKWVSLSDSTKLDDRYISETDKEISMEGILHSSAVLHPMNTVILCRDAAIGKVGILGKEGMAVSQHFMAWQCHDDLYYIFLYYLLQSRRREFEQIAVGTTIKTIGLPFFKKLLIPLPPLEEQIKIAENLWAVDSKIDLEKRSKEHLVQLKQGLMSDLLSGRVRIALE